jgi:hypothetical protein
MKLEGKDIPGLLTGLLGVIYALATLLHCVAEKEEMQTAIQALADLAFR